MLRDMSLKALLTSVILFGGCAVFDHVYEGRYSSLEGWREAEVLEVGSQLPPRRAVFDCRTKKGFASRGPLYAYVTYQRAPGRRDFQIVSIRADQGLKPGDPVYIKIWDCEAETPRRSVSGS